MQIKNQEDLEVNIIEDCRIRKRGRKAIASDLKSDDRKVMWVRILPLPLKKVLVAKLAVMRSWRNWSTRLP